MQNSTDCLSAQAFPTRAFVTKASAALSLSIASCFTALPSQAVTFAESTGGFSFSNFSKAPLGTDSTALTSSFTNGEGAFAFADSDARFDAFPDAEAVNFITNSTATSDNPGAAFARSEASILGDFAVTSGEVFSFDFFGFADLLTSVDQPTESASVFLDTQYSLFRSDIGIDNGVIVDSFGLFGLITTPGSEDFLKTERSGAITLDIFNVAEETGTDLLSEFIIVDVAGSYERLFEQDSILTLVEFKVGAAEGSNQAQVPDASSPLVGLLAVGTAAFWMKQRKYAE